MDHHPPDAGVVGNGGSVVAPPVQDAQASADHTDAISHLDTNIVDATGGSEASGTATGVDCSKLSLQDQPAVAKPVEVAMKQASANAEDTDPDFKRSSDDRGLPEARETAEAADAETPLVDNSPRPTDRAVSEKQELQVPPESSAEPFGREDPSNAEHENWLKRIQVNPQQTPPHEAKPDTDAIEQVSWEPQNTAETRLTAPVESASVEADVKPSTESEDPASAQNVPAEGVDVETPETGTPKNEPTELEAKSNTEEREPPRPEVADTVAHIVVTEKEGESTSKEDSADAERHEAPEDRSKARVVAGSTDEKPVTDTLLREEQQAIPAAMAAECLDSNTACAERAELAESSDRGDQDVQDTSATPVDALPAESAATEPAAAAGQPVQDSATHLHDATEEQGAVAGAEVGARVGCVAAACIEADASSAAIAESAEKPDEGAAESEARKESDGTQESANNPLEHHVAEEDAADTPEVTDASSPEATPELANAAVTINGDECSPQHGVSAEAPREHEAARRDSMREVANCTVQQLRKTARDSLADFGREVAEQCSQLSEELVRGALKSWADRLDSLIGELPAIAIDALLPAPEAPQAPKNEMDVESRIGLSSQWSPMNDDQAEASEEVVSSLRHMRRQIRDIFKSWSPEAQASATLRSSSRHPTVSNRGSFADTSDQVASETLNEARQQAGRDINPPAHADPQRDHRQRKHRHRHRSAQDSAPRREESGAPPRSSSRAEEPATLVRARSLLFGADEEDGQSMWGHPTRRSNDVVNKARDRAEEVLRTERQQHGARHMHAAYPHIR